MAAMRSRTGETRISELTEVSSEIEEAKLSADRTGGRQCAWFTPASGVGRQSGRTFSACGPFCPWVVSNSTFWFSFSDL